MCCNEFINPYKAVNDLKGFDYSIKNRKDFAVVSEHIGESIDNSSSEFRGYAFALKTFGKVRGADFSEIDYVLRDEFVPQPGQLRFEDEADMFFNFYETVSRNREKQGRAPLKVIMLSNAVSIESPLLRELGLVGILETMLRKGQRRFTDPARGVYIELPYDADFAEEKSETALYRLTTGTKYYEHAIDNKFAYNSWYNVRRCNIKEYKPVCCVLGVTIYRHKSNGTYYATTIRADCPTFTQDTLSLFHRNFFLPLREVNISGRLYYESYAVKSIICDLIT